MYTKIVRFLISCFDFYNKKKILKLFKSKLGNKIEVIIDVGAHYGETINLFNNNFVVSKFYAFEASPLNYTVLKKKLFKGNSINNIYNYAIGPDNTTLLFNQSKESSSSTLVKINQFSNYYIRKSRVLNFFSSQPSFKTIYVKSISMNSFLTKQSINNIDILKIDTEGYDLNVIKSLKDNISKVKFIYFEHHFHNMLIKGYTLTDIHDYLTSANFIKIFKLKMSFRKTFEYVYKNKNL